MELAGFEPATSWMPCSLMQLTKRLICGEFRDPSPLSGRIGRVLICWGFAGLWSALNAARTSGAAAMNAAASSSEPDRSEEVKLKS